MPKLVHAKVPAAIPGFADRQRGLTDLLRVKTGPEDLAH